MSCHIVPGTLLNVGDDDMNSALGCPPGAYSLGIHRQAQDLPISNIICLFSIHLSEF